VYRPAGVVKTFANGTLATIETEAPHLYVVGDVVDLDVFNSSVSATFNGEYEITARSDTTFSFAKIANSASTVVTGSAYAGQDVTGYVTVVAYGNGSELSDVEKLNLITDVRAKSVAGLVLDMVDPAFATLEITGSIKLNEEYEQAALIETIEDIIVDYLSPQSFSLSSDRIRQTQVIALISNIPGVVYVESLTLTPTGTQWLPKYGVDLLFRYKNALPLLSLDDIDITYASINVGT
jgi:predicted aconitase with swiveling domain